MTVARNRERSRRIERESFVGDSKRWPLTSVSERDGLHGGVHCEYLLHFGRQHDDAFIAEVDGVTFFRSSNPREY